MLMGQGHTKEKAYSIQSSLALLSSGINSASRDNNQPWPQDGSDVKNGKKNERNTACPDGKLLLYTHLLVLKL